MSAEVILTLVFIQLTNMKMINVRFRGSRLGKLIERKRKWRRYWKSYFFFSTSSIDVLEENEEVVEDIVFLDDVYAPDIYVNSILLEEAAGYKPRKNKYKELKLDEEDIAKRADLKRLDTTYHVVESHGPISVQVSAQVMTMSDKVEILTFLDRLVVLHNGKYYIYNNEQND